MGSPRLVYSYREFLSPPPPPPPSLGEKFLYSFVSFCYIGETFKWFKGGCSNYTFHAKSPPVTWERSRQLCRKTGLGALVSIESEAEWMFLKNTVQKLTIATEYFIGLKEDDRSRQWRWLSNKSASQTSLPWATGEPNGDGKCVTMYKDYGHMYGEYKDVDCTTYPRSGYICEFPVDNCNQDGKSYAFLMYLSCNLSSIWRSVLRLAIYWFLPPNLVPRAFF